MHVTPSPEKPGLHTHTKLPRVLKHVASASQLSVPEAHSFTSTVTIVYIMLIKLPNVLYLHSPIHMLPDSTNPDPQGSRIGLQVNPFPMKPALHTHTKLPGMLKQSALGSQLAIPYLHSLMS